MARTSGKAADRCSRSTAALPKTNLVSTPTTAPPAATAAPLPPRAARTASDITSWSPHMNQPDIFGPDLDEAGVSYQSIAAQIKALKPRNLSQGSLEDVLTMIEWMQQEVSKRDEL